MGMGNVYVQGNKEGQDTLPGFSMDLNRSGKCCLENS